MGVDFRREDADSQVQTLGALGFSLQQSHPTLMAKRRVFSFLFLSGGTPLRSQSAPSVH